MKKFSIEPDVAGRYALAVTAGIVASLGFAPAQLDGAAWVGPGMILFCALGCRGARAFRLGFAAGLAHFLASLYWLLAMPFAWHGIPLAPALAWVLLSAYCAAYFGLWVWSCWKVFPSNELGEDLSLIEVVDEFLLTPAWQRVCWAFLCAASWTALEVARGRVLGGFPWNFLAVSQYRLIPVTQIASVTGVYGVTFLMVWFSVALLASLLGLARRPSTQRIWSDMALPLLAVTWVTGYGMTKLAQVGSSERTIKVALVQPSIPQSLIFDPKEDARRFEQLISLSDEALAAKPADLLLWPESAVPDLSPENQQAIGQFLAHHHVWLILCTDLTERKDSGKNALFNSSVLISPEGEARAVYHKRRLVIFGEYVPLEKWLPFLKWFTPVLDGYTPGDRPVEFKLTHPEANSSVLICFEDMFPEEAREHAGPDIDFLINLTNDGWFGEGPEQMQQAASAVFRAVENGLPLIRCANNGLTCWIDGQGRLRQIAEERGSIYGRGFMTVTIPLAPTSGHQPTIYHRYGDWFGWSCCGFSCGALILRWLGQKMSSDAQDSV